MFALFTVQRVGSEETARNKHIHTKRDPRGCFFTHSKIGLSSVSQTLEKRCIGAASRDRRGLGLQSLATVRRGYSVVTLASAVFFFFEHHGELVRWNKLTARPPWCTGTSHTSRFFWVCIRAFFHSISVHLFH